MTLYSNLDLCTSKISIINEIHNKFNNYNNRLKLTAEQGNKYKINLNP